MGPTPGLPGGGPVQLSLQGRTRMGGCGGHSARWEPQRVKGRGSEQRSLPWRPWGPGPAAGMTLSWESFIQPQGWPGPRSDHAQATEKLPPTDGPGVSRARPGGPGHSKHGVGTNNGRGDPHLVNMCPCSAHSCAPRAALGGPCSHTTSHSESSGLWGCCGRETGASGEG